MDLMSLFIKIGVEDAASSAIEKISATTIASGQLMADAISMATEKLVEFGRKAVESYADYEQLAGGIETLFKESSGQVQEFASEAYKTAGLSANEYMETVTSFSASLLQATGRGAQTNLEQLEGYLEAEYETAKETYSAEYEERKKALDASYKATKESYDAQYDALKASQEAEIKEYTAAADAKIAAIDKSNKEALAAAKQEKADTLAAMKEGNKKELDELKKANKQKLDAQKQANTDELAELKKSNTARLNEQKQAIADQVAAAEEANMVSVTTLESQALAAELANQAIIDMSDNANKMGTDMSLIQNAYQGFAKANYTMLDNLKLGYGGTKEEMERLIADAAKLSDTVDAQSLSFDNIVKAIHVVQDELGITGTTAKEAGATISGSISSMNAAMENLVVGIADDNADLAVLFGNLVTTIVGDGSDANRGVLGNLLPRVKQTFKGMGKLLEEVAPEVGEAASYIVDEIVKFLESPKQLFTFLDGAKAIVEHISNDLKDANVLEKLGDGVLAFVEKITEYLQDSKILQSLVAGATSVIRAFGGYLAENADEIILSALALLEALADGLLDPQNLTELADAAVDVVKKLGDELENNANEIGEGVGAILLEIVSAFKEFDWEGVGGAIGADILLGLVNSLGDLSTYIGNSITAAMTEALHAIGLMSDEDYEREMRLAGRGMMEGGAWYELMAGIGSGVHEYKEPELAGANITGGMNFGTSNKELDDYIAKMSGASVSAGDITPDNIISNSFTGNGVPAGEVYNVSLELDGETLANVLIDPLNKTARQKGVNVFA